MKKIFSIILILCFTFCMVTPCYALSDAEADSMQSDELTAVSPLSASYYVVYYSFFVEAGGTFDNLPIPNADKYVIGTFSDRILLFTTSNDYDFYWDSGIFCSGTCKRYILRSSSNDYSDFSKYYWVATGTVSSSYLWSNTPIFSDNTLTEIMYYPNVGIDTDTDTDTETLTDVDTDSVVSDFDNTSTAIKIRKFIDTFSAILRLLFVFLIMVLLYKFFNIFF